MRRILIVCLALAAAAAAAAAAAGSGGPSERRGSTFTVELDNAFGLTQGSDVKVAGVRAGQITGMRVDPRTTHALIDMTITEKGFGDLRTDAFCETRPQSLIGEYFLDCKPGTARRRLTHGGTVPVERPGSTIPVDVVNNIMRRPYRERFSILLSELGAGLAARGPDLNTTIRRANPALRETDRVLKVLARQRRVIRDLYRDADNVVGRLADNRKDVTRFVREARDTASTVADRDGELRRQYQTFPTFL